jgi:hypothetical protein
VSEAVGSKKAGKIHLHEKGVDEEVAEDDVPQVGDRPKTVDRSVSFKRPEMIAMLMQRISDHGGWVKGRKVGFLLVLRNKLLRKHFAPLLGGVEDDDEDEGGGEEEAGVRKAARDLNSDIKAVKKLAKGDEDEGGEEEEAGGRKAARDLNSDIKAVKKLAKGFGKELGWLLDGNDCNNPGSWVGVEVDGERIVKIDWSGQNLSGILDGRLLRRLDGLRELDVHNNGIAGIIPVQLEEMEKLEVLRVYQNRLGGPLKTKKLVDMRVCDVVRSDNKMVDGNSFTSDGCPQRFVAQMERHRVRVCAREMGMDGLKREDGKGPDGAWKGVKWDAEGWVVGIDWTECELKGVVADEMKHFQRLEYVS